MLLALEEASTTSKVTESRDGGEISPSKSPSTNEKEVAIFAVNHSRLTNS